MHEYNSLSPPTNKKPINFLAEDNKIFAKDLYCCSEWYFSTSSNIFWDSCQRGCRFFVYSTHEENKGKIIRETGRRTTTTTTTTSTVDNPESLNMNNEEVAEGAVVIVLKTSSTQTIQIVRKMC